MGKAHRSSVGMWLAVVAVVAAVTLASPAAAFAHVPVLEPAAPSDRIGVPADPYPAANPIPGPDASRAIYGFLAADERFDAYRFRVQRKLTATVSVLVPVAEGSDRFRPNVTVLLQNRVLAEVRDQGTPRETFFEPFSLTRLYRGPEEAVTFEPGNDYVLLVEPGAGSRRTGAYVVAFSGAETFSFPDALRTLLDLPRIWLGLYGQGEPNVGPIVVLVVVLVAAGAVVDTVRRQRRRRRRLLLNGR